MRARSNRYTAGEIGRVRVVSDFRPARIRARKGSGNVVTDLGLPNPEQELFKARLTLQIYKIIKARGLMEALAGEVLGIKQPLVSTLMRNRQVIFPWGD